MDNEIQLINDGRGVAIIGNSATVDRFVRAQGLVSRELSMAKVGNVVGRASGIAQGGAEVAAQSGRWVKLTEQSARALKQGTLMKGSEAGVSRAVLTENGGKIKGILEIVRTPGSLLANPAVLSGAAGIMSQLAMQQQMEEITRYLKGIDEKCDDILQAQKDVIFSDMIAVGKSLDEAIIIRDQVGRVSEVTWSKIQGSQQILLKTQDYALRQLESLANKVDAKLKVGELAGVSAEIDAKVQEWLVVLARCLQLNDSLAVLELDRVLDSSVADLDDHRQALEIARSRRQDEISQVAGALLERLSHAAAVADKNLLFHPSSAKKTVRHSGSAASQLDAFSQVIALDMQRTEFVDRTWAQALVETRDRALDAGKEGVDVAKRVGSESLKNAQKASSRITEEMSEKLEQMKTRSNFPDDL